jgi:hypothetical protein
MTRFGTLAAPAQRLGLVIVFPPGVRGLFNPAVHRLVRSVEARLDDVFVTHALSSGAAPDVGAAVAAARFAGCSSAVVVHCEDWVLPANGIDPKADTVWSAEAGPIDVEHGVAAVLAAFHGARTLQGLAA